MITLVALLLFFVSVTHSKNEPIDKVQDLVLQTINETAAPDFVPCNDHLIKKAAFADMFEIKRSGYFHWCVFVSNRTVIQLNNPEFDKLSMENAFDNFTGQVELRNLIQLAGEDFCRINNKLNESKRKNLQVLSKFEILNTMRDELKHNVTYYNLVNNNCEHFAAKVKFGVPFSSQVHIERKTLLE